MEQLPIWLLASSLFTSVKSLIAKRVLIFQMDNDFKYTTNDTWNWFENKKIKLLKWPCQSPDFNPTENVSECELKIRVHARQLTDMTIWWRFAWKNGLQFLQMSVQSSPLHIWTVTGSNCYQLGYAAEL